MPHHVDNSEAQSINWSQLYEFRKAVQKRWPTIWQVPIRKRYHQVVLEECKGITSMLEIGAGGRGFKRFLDKHYAEMNYRSFDIDRTNEHDFYSLDSITGEYDACCLFEMIEHVTPELALETLVTAFERIKPGGKVIVSTPNIYYPPEFLRDATHITPWCYDELGAIIQHAGFESVSVYRLFQDKWYNKLLKRYLGYGLFRMLGIDFCKGIIFVGQKPV